jgi:hypothetical protein
MPEDPPTSRSGTRRKSANYDEGKEPRQALHIIRGPLPRGKEPQFTEEEMAVRAGHGGLTA